MRTIGEFKIGALVERDMYIAVCEAYDTTKKCWCYLTIPQRPTSWEFAIDY